MTDNAREAGPDHRDGPAREQVVIRDKRKVDASGRPKNPEGARGDAKATEPAGEAHAGRASGAADAAGSSGAADTAGPAGAAKATEPAGGKPRTGAADNPKVDATMGQPGIRVAEGGASAPRTAGGDRAKAEPRPAKPDGKVSEKAGTKAAGVDEATSRADEAVSGEPAAADVGGKGALGAELEALRSALDERLADLQRVTAEYHNYRKRVERDRGVMAEQTVAAVISTLLPILDDLDRAREHGDLVGPFGAVAEQLSGTLSKFGLTGFGEQGDPFDPTRHEAVAHQTSADVTEPTCVAVMRRGYLLGDRLLRAAMVAVADPE